MELKVGMKKEEGERKFPALKPLTERLARLATVMLLPAVISCGGGPTTDGGKDSGNDPDGGISQDGGGMTPWACTEPSSSPNVATFNLGDSKPVYKTGVNIANVVFNEIFPDIHSGNMMANIQITAQGGTGQSESMKPGDSATYGGVSIQLCAMTQTACYSSTVPPSGDTNCKVTVSSSLGWQP